MQKIKFVRTQKSKETDERGWIYDRVTAFSGKEEIGHVTISYIPKSIFIATYPTILHWNWVCKGFCYSSKEERTAPFDEWTYEELCDFIEGIARYEYCSYPEIPETKAKCLKFLRKKAKRYETLIGKAYREWIDYHVDKPEAAYVAVNEEFRGKGIGKKLYVEAHKWMQERELRFYESSQKNSYGRALWASLVTCDMTERSDDGRHYIKYE